MTESENPEPDLSEGWPEEVRAKVEVLLDSIKATLPKSAKLGLLVRVPIPPRVYTDPDGMMVRENYMMDWEVVTDGKHILSRFLDRLPD